MICQACNGVVGRDCFNPEECMEILHAQAAMYQQMSERQNEQYRECQWSPQSLSTTELLDVLRRNHLAMNRNDSPYWQAEQKIRELLQTLDMVAAIAARCDSVAGDEIVRLLESAKH